MRLLTETGPRLGFTVSIIPEVSVGGGDVNSTRIRGLLEEGKVVEAAELLDRPYSIRGKVVEGDHRGQRIGFPTANLAPESEILPAAGVYAGELRLIDGGEPARGVCLPSVMNVGHRPTFRDGQGLIAEAHVIDFEGDLYGRSVELSFRCRLRAEQKFPTVDDLRAQIARDVADARRQLEIS